VRSQTRPGRPRSGPQSGPNRRRSCGGR
jgi:hypothetical protein